MSTVCAFTFEPDWSLLPAPSQRYIGNEGSVHDSNDCPTLVPHFFKRVILYLVSRADLEGIDCFL